MKISKPRKSIKKTLKILFVFFLVVLSLPTIGYFVLQNNKVQHYLVQKISAKLSAKLGTEVSLDQAKIDLFSNFHLKNLLIRDKERDTMIFVPDFTIVPGAFSLTSRFVEMSKIKLNDPLIYFRIDSANVINLQFIIDNLVSKDTTSKKEKWEVSLRQIVIQNGHFTLKNAYYSEREFGINFSDIDLNPLNIEIEGLRNTDSGVEIKIKKLQFTEKSGFSLDNLSGRMNVNKENLSFTSLELNTNKTSLNANQVRLNFEMWKDLGVKTIFKNVKFALDLNKSTLSTNDLAYFVPVFKDYNLNIKLQGSVKGPINDLKAKNLEIWYGNQTYIKTNADISGLPDIRNTFMHIDIKSLNTNPSDIDNFYIPRAMKAPIRLSTNLKQISWLKYKGKFTGFISDFVAYGTFSSNLGTIESDISLKPDTSYVFDFNGKLKTDGFKIGKLTGQEPKIGDIALNAYAKGKFGKKGDFNLDINGNVNSFFVNGYDYKNAQIKGIVTPKTFQGNLILNDPNAKLTFKGNVNFEKSSPVFDFEANVKHVNLFKLNFDQKDSSYSASFYATANFEGSSIDNARGELRLWESTFRKTGKEIHINDLLLFTQNINDTNRIIIRSSIADAEIWGIYKFKEMASSFKSLFKPYFPTLITGTVTDTAKSNNFKFDINFKDSRELTDFMVPGLYISKDAQLTGNYDASKRNLSFLFKVPLLQHNIQKWYNVYFNGWANADSLSIISGCKNLKLSNQLNFENFTFLSSFRNDSVKLALRWNNWDTLNYKGNFNLSGVIGKSSPWSRPNINLSLLPSQLVLRDTSWLVKANNVFIDSSGFSVNDFLLSHQLQSIMASGKMSNNKEDNVVVKISNLNLAHIKSIYTPKKFDFAGVINGDVKLSNLFTNADLDIALVVDSLAVNGQNIGKTKLNANWDIVKKNIALNLTSYRGQLQTLMANGDINPGNKTIALDIELNRLRIDVFEPLLSGIFSNIHGVASGNLRFTGTTTEPILNGTLKAQKATFMVNYLKTRYNFTDNIQIKNNAFVFNNVEVFDSNSNKAYVNGSILFDKFRDIILDLKIDAREFECLNTTDKELSNFYGKGYATGLVTIKGTSPIIQMDINATTNKGTAIFIPLLLKGDISTSDFIRILQKEKTEDPYQKYEIDTKENLSDNSSINPSFKLNLNLNVTPDAEAELVFDQKIGDYVLGNGSGKLSLIIDGGRFNMYGVYTIEKGKYMFTLQNVINKKFEVKPGSTISWTGDPLDAIINLEAKYKVEAPLYDLLLENTEDFKKRIPIDCRLWLSEKLMNPVIKYDINLPSSDQVTKTKVESAINTEDKKSLEFLSLLVLGSFVPPDPTSNSATASNLTRVSAAEHTGLEFLSNQLSNWLSQISNNFDIGFKYHPGDDISNREVEVIMSYQLLNDRIILNGNVDVGMDNPNTKVTNNKTSNIVGDFNLEYKVTDNGKLRMKAFNRSNENNFEEKSSPYTQGLGIFYKEDFNTLPELFRNYYRNFKSKKKDYVTPDSTGIIKATTDTVPKFSDIVPLQNLNN